MMIHQIHPKIESVKKNYPKNKSKIIGSLVLIPTNTVDGRNPAPPGMFKTL